MLGFWGLTVLPEKTYTQVVENSFKLSMAALDEVTKAGRSSVRVTVDKKTFILCNLISGKVEQQTLDLVFTEGESITFSVSGENSVHLSGNYLPEDDGMDFDSEDMDEDEDEDDEDEEIEDDEGDEEDEEDEEEEEETVIVTKGAKRVAKFEEPKKQVAEKKQKITEEKAVPVKVKAEAKEEHKKEAKKEVKKEEPKKAALKKEEPKNDSKKVLANGLIIEDVKVGTGPAAKSGKKIGMRYIGRLTNGKVFDKNTSGKPFNFNLGRGEVIKGWDLGIQGMQLGGERRLTIPAPLAYGSQGAPPDIPRNATLVFEVKLVTLK
ncbi:peptidylprolyl isomerase fpr4 [Mortierella sp. AD011]|nr:peptidylprolyl isomerase fpr4 [Mortierella sp. AD010]KAF9398075.1 peptidylprolyl isomerase fpr4 [Mortierella sp. AD011]